MGELVQIEHCGKLVTYEITGNLSLEGLLRMFEAWNQQDDIIAANGNPQTEKSS